jgi:hypothetical protein
LRVKPPCEPALEPPTVGEQRRARPFVDHAAAVEHDGAVGDRQDQARVLLDDDGAQALVAHQPGDRAQQLLDDDRREALERLVEQQQLRVEDQGPADREHLLLAAGKLVAEVAGGARRGAETSRRLAPRSRARGGPPRSGSRAW